MAKDSDIRLDRVPPQDMDSERAVLGAILLSGGNGDTLAIVRSKLGNGLGFYRQAHQEIFGAMLNVSDRGDPVDLLTLTKELERLGHLEKVGGVAYLDEMQDSVPTTENVGYYADFVLEAAARRELIQASIKAFNEAFLGEFELDDVAKDLEETLIAIRRRQGVNELCPIKQVIKPVFDEAQRVYQTKEMITGLSTGLTDLDELTSGFHEGEYILLAGRPGIGKSTLGRNIVQHVGLKLKKPVLLFSIEAAKPVVVARILASEAGVKYHDLRRGFIPEAKWAALTVAAGELSQSPIYIDDSCDLTPALIRAKCQMFLAKHDAGLIIIDHLHDVIPDEPLRNREQEINRISKSFKAIARAFGVPLISLAQLNRAPERREYKKPGLPDLRGSGSLEQHGDVIMFLYRDDYYTKDKEDHSAEIILEKQRNGPTGIIKVVYDHAHDRYNSMYKKAW